MLITIYHDLVNHDLKEIYSVCWLIDGPGAGQLAMWLYTLQWIVGFMFPQ